MGAVQWKGYPRCVHADHRDRLGCFRHHDSDRIGGSGYRLCASGRHVCPYKGLKISDLPGLFKEAILSSANVMIIIAFCGIFTWILALEHVTEAVGMLFMQMQLSPTANLAGDQPHHSGDRIFRRCQPGYSVADADFSAGVETDWRITDQFGAVLITGLAVGLVTPPVGMCLNVCSAISGISIVSVFRGAAPFLIANVLVLVLVATVPAGQRLATDVGDGAIAIRLDRTIGV